VGGIGVLENASAISQMYRISVWVFAFLRFAENFPIFAANIY